MQRSRNPVLLLIPLLCGSVFAQAGGDTCASPTPIFGVGTWTWDNTLNTTSGFDGGDPSTCFSPSASGSSSDEIRKDLFFAWTVPADGDYQFDTEGSPVNTDTKMSIHLGADCSATCVAADDDSGDAPVYSSKIILSGLAAGDQYLIQIGSWNDTSPVGAGLLHILCAGIPDSCSSAFAITGTGSFGWDNSLATTSGFDGGGSGTCFSPSGGTTATQQISRDLFFAWTVPAGGGDFEINTEGSSVNTDTKLSIHTGSDCSATCLAADDDSGDVPRYSSKVVLTGLSAGDQYLIQVGSWTSASPAGEGVLNISAWQAPPANDACAGASHLTGLGSWAFDTSFATASLLSGVSVCGPNPEQMLEDIFFTWNAPAAGDYQLSTCGSSYDTLLAVYSGTSCASSCAEYNDDGLCGNYASQVLLSGASAGQGFLIQVAGFQRAHGGGTLSIAALADPCDPIVDDAFEDNESCAAAPALGDGLWPGLAVLPGDLDLYSLTVAAGETLSVSCDHDLFDADLDLYLFSPAGCDSDPYSDPDCAPALACGFSSSIPETLTWTNSSAIDQQCILRVSPWTLSSGQCAEYDLSITGSAGSSVTRYCDPAAAHSGGGPVRLTASLVTSSGLHIDAAGGPSNQFAMFVVSATMLDPGLAVSQGYLCLGNPIGRYGANAGAGLNSVGRFDAAGVLQNLSGTSLSGIGFDVPAALPSPPSGTISAGSTWHFQLWYRDGAASNFSDALAVAF